MTRRKNFQPTPETREFFDELVQLLADALERDLSVAHNHAETREAINGEASTEKTLPQSHPR